MPTKDEIIDIILNSYSKNDWGYVAVPAIQLDGEGGICLPYKSVKYYKNDVHLRFEELEKDNDSFIADWANDFPEPKAFSYIYMLYYGSTPIMRFSLVAVDGLRAYLPIPDLPTKLEVERLEFKVAEIHNSDDISNFRDYMNRAGLTVKDD